MEIKNGSLFLFKLFGVRVYANWLWLPVAAVIVWRQSVLSRLGGENLSVGFFIALYLCLFLIVLMHEFGHSLACKSVGGVAEEIMLWPLGGVAYVQPPQRAGAMLWSIVAGPLVNVVLLPLLFVPAVVLNGFAPGTFAGTLLWFVAWTNVVLLAFNLLPFYPLDGGQIVRSLLWFVCGRGLSLIIAAVLGLCGTVLLAGLVLYAGWTYTGLVVLFVGSRSYTGLRQGLLLLKIEKTPRRQEAVCPNCGQHPPRGTLWRCPCGMQFDTFQNAGSCPACTRAFETTSCPFCLRAAPLGQWYPPETVGMGT
jgi:Zn-dependent protease